MPGRREKSDAGEPVTHVLVKLSGTTHQFANTLSEVGDSCQSQVKDRACDGRARGHAAHTLFRQKVEDGLLLSSYNGMQDATSFTLQVALRLRGCYNNAK